MQARYYDPVIGRFYSNDPVGWNPKNPVHSFGRYTYANNNPYKYTDPTGMEGEETYKKEIEKPEFKTITVEIDVVVSVETTPNSDISVGLISGSVTKNSTVDLGGVVSLGETTDLKTGEETTSIKLSKGPLSASMNSKNELTVAGKLGPISVEGKTNLADTVHNVNTAGKSIIETITSSVPRGF